MSQVATQLFAWQSALSLAAGAAAVVAVAGAARTTITHPARTIRSTTSKSDRAPTSPRARWGAALAGAMATAVVTGPLIVGVVAGLVFLGRKLRPVRDARRRAAAIEQALPDAMDLLVLSIRAGLTPFQAVRELADSVEPPIGPVFAEAVRRTQRGQQFADALAALPEQLGPAAGGLADVIATSDRHGLALGPVLDQLTAEVRSARRRLDQADARKLPVRLSFPLVTCTLPSFVLLAIAPAVIAALSSLGGTAW